MASFGITVAMVKLAALRAIPVLEVTYYGLDGGAVPPLVFDLGGEAAPVL